MARMHEARVARSVAREIEGRGLAGHDLRLVVSGGHADREAFDAALRTQLSVALPDVDVAAIEIVHRPGPHLCNGCAGAFIAPRGGRCPMCGADVTPLPAPERIELEWAER
jgi:hypothetical protein